MRRGRPPVKHKPLQEFHIIPFFTDQVRSDGDLFRFLVPGRMTLKSVSVRIDNMNSDYLLLNGGVQSGDRKFAISEPVRLGVNVLMLDLPVNEGDVLIMNFDDKELASQDVSGVTVSIRAVR